MKGNEKRIRQAAIPSNLSQISSSLSNPNSVAGNSFDYQNHRHPRNPPQIDEGALIAGRYCLESLISSGATGQVFSARDLRSSEMVAVKIFHSWLVNQNHLLELFTYGFLRMKRISHDNIVRVFHLERDSSHRVWYLVMEYVPGVSLQQMLDTRTSEGLVEPFSLPQILHFFEALVPTIQFLHNKHIVHRDLKPSHLLWNNTDGKSDFKLTGFGMSASVSEVCASSINLGQISASLYTAPEHMLDSLKATTATDIFSLGVILYQLLTGRLPVGMAEMPSAIYPHIPVGIDKVLRCALSPHWQKRYSSIDAFWSAVVLALDPAAKSERGPHEARSYKKRNPAFGTHSSSLKLSPVSVQDLLPEDKAESILMPRQQEYDVVIGRMPDHGSLYEEPMFSPDSVGQANFNLTQRSRAKAPSTTQLEQIDAQDAGTGPIVAPDSYRGGAYRPRNPTAALEPPSISSAWIPEKSPVSNAQRLDRLRESFSTLDEETQTSSSLPSMPRPPRSLSFRTEQSDLSKLAFSPDGCFLASAASDGTIKLWDVPSWYLLHTIKLSGSAIRNISWGPTGHWLAMSDDSGHIHVRNVMDPNKRHSFAINTRCLALTWSKDGRYLWAGGADGVARIWEFGSIYLPQELLLHRGEICALSTLNNPQMFQIGQTPCPFILSGGTDGCISLWDVNIKQPIIRFSEPGTSICSIATHPINSLFISGNDRGEIQYWEPKFSGQTRSWQAHYGPLCHLQLSHHGEWFISGDAGSVVKMWRTDDGELLTSFSTSQIPLQAVTLSPDSQWLAIAEQDDNVKLWDVSAWNPS